MKKMISGYDAAGVIGQVLRLNGGKVDEYVIENALRFLAGTKGKLYIHVAGPRNPGLKYPPSETGRYEGPYVEL